MTFPPLDSLPPGFRIERRYEVQRLLGSGRQGFVYAVLDHHLREPAALKLLPTSAEGVGVWKEAVLLKRVSGHYLLPVLNADLASGVPYIVTSIAEHGTIADQIVPAVGTGVSDARSWARHASRGLARMHDLELIHNDVKPANLFLDGARAVQVGDLGFARRLYSDGTAGVTGCAPGTTAPEVAAHALGLWSAANDRPASVVSDVYSLGATLYWMLAGEAPYYGGSPEQVLTGVVAGPPPRLRDVAPHVPVKLARIVETAMARDPAKRFASMAELDAALGYKGGKDAVWSRRSPHSGHQTCFATEAGKLELEACVETVPGSVANSITVRHAKSGRRKGEAVTCKPNELPVRLRAVFRQHR
ncbi:serine/threonine-protein kinase [Agromyces sp. NPDC058104]|uniref:serine/threonine-protein kinase n=1 Tax=Agromyces sp. NPDC058104 TaxID=3346342 RepID=UPI0036DF749A